VVTLSEPGRSPKGAQPIPKAGGKRARCGKQSDPSGGKKIKKKIRQAALKRLGLKGLRKQRMWQSAENEENEEDARWKENRLPSLAGKTAGWDGGRGKKRKSGHTANHAA